MDLMPSAWRGHVADLWTRLLGSVRDQSAAPAASMPVLLTPAAVRAEKPAAPPAEVFTPTRPRGGRRTLVGRQEEVARVLEAVCDDGAHVVLYAERGRGKTSLSNLAIEAMRRRGVIVARYACDADSTFDSILHGLAADLPQSLLVNAATADSDGCDLLLPAGPVCPADAAAIPRSLRCPKVAFVVDDFDRVADHATRISLADTVRLVSEQSVPLHFVIVGVPATFDDIIRQQPSITHNIAAMHLPLLTDQEVAAMITGGGEQSGIAFSQEAVALIVGVARGMPYMAQLLGLRIAQAALQRRHPMVQGDDLLTAVQRLIDETAFAVVATYNRLTDGGRDADMATALLRLAEAEPDRWGRLRMIADSSGVAIGGRRFPAALWLRLRNAAILMRCGSDPGLLQFADRALITYVQLLAARTRVIGERQFKQVPAGPDPAAAPPRQSLSVTESQEGLLS